MCKPIHQTNLDIVSPLLSEYATGSSSNSSPPRRAVCRTVTFSETSDEMFLIPLVSEMSSDEIKDTWYTTRETKAIRRSMVKVIKRMMATETRGIGDSSADENETDDSELEPTRGLEKKTRRGSIARHKNWCAGLWAVLDEQGRQREEQQTNPANIAELYRQNTAHCQVEANEIAAIDARIVARDTTNNYSSSSNTNNISAAQEGAQPQEPAPSPPTSTTEDAISTAVRSISIGDNNEDGNDDERIPPKSLPAPSTSVVQNPANTLAYIMANHKPRSRRRLL